MALDIVTSKQFKKDMKLYKRNDKVKEELNKVIKILVNNEPLPTEKRDHGLSGELKDFRDCHIFPNIVLIYKIKGNELYLARIGSHSKLEITESIIKLRIKEDTACVASKTSYMNEDGLDANGIYYFGNKPKKPINWKDYKKGKKNKKIKERVTEMIIKEGYEDIVRYYEVDSKQVRDSDGFWDDYTMYEEYVIPYDEYIDFIKNYKKGDFYKDEWFNRYVFVFGDKELYDPSDGYDEWDYECESEKEAYEWFEDYNGFYDEDEDF